MARTAEAVTTLAAAGETQMPSPSLASAAGVARTANAASVSGGRQVKEDLCREGLCPKYQKAMALLGKRWTGLVLRVLLDGPCRFGDFLARIDGISDPILSERLKELECQGLVQRRVLPETPVRVEYALTPKGEGLREILLLLHKWAEQWGNDQHVECDEC
jgi:DNA-binding HxlR family transcriptional regulator